MMLTRFGHCYMNTRALEAMLATLMMSCGTVLLFPGETFSLPHYGLVRTYLPENTAGALLLVIGAARCLAIYYNGNIRQSPILRLAGCAIGGGLWLTIALAIETPVLQGRAAGPPLMFAVACTAFLFEFYSGLRAGSDASDLDSFGVRAARSKVRF